MAEEIILDVYLTPDIQLDIESGGSGGGVSAHNELTNLEYSKSGHTGFASASDISSERTARIDADTVLQTNIENAEAIARGRSRSWVFQTLSELDTWLSNPDNRTKLQIGDNLFTIDVDTPDFWWDGSNKQYLGGEGGVPTGPAGGDLEGTYPNPTIKSSKRLPNPKSLIFEKEGELLGYDGSDELQIRLDGQWGDFYGNIEDQSDLIDLLANFANKSIPLTTTAISITLFPNQEVYRATASTPTVTINATSFGDGEEAMFIQTGAYTPTISVTGLTLMYVGAWTSITPAINRDVIYMFKRNGNKLYVTRNISATTQL